MTKTYSRTLMIPDLAQAVFTVTLYDQTKYEAEDDGQEVEYTDVSCWSIISDEDAKEIEDSIDEEMHDENHEYLILNFMDGSIATFRNSHVDLHIRRKRG